MPAYTWVRKKQFFEMGENGYSNEIVFNNSGKKSLSIWLEPFAESLTIYPQESFLFLTNGNKYVVEYGIDNFDISFTVDQSFDLVVYKQNDDGDYHLVENYSW